jgi:UDP-2-acetamido-2,6-beta-L-arabino-hexul-4-ose reductase
LNSNPSKKILVTGANGFIGKNLIIHLNELTDSEVICFGRNNNNDELISLINKSDFVFHLAGENRPKDISAFNEVNTELTKKICIAIEKTGRNIPLIFSSSSQVEKDNPYGQSKLAAEEAIKEYSRRSNNTVSIYRLPGVFGKWCKPNYNSVVATFCYNIARGLPIQVNDPNYNLQILYIDDLIRDFLANLEIKKSAITNGQISKVYNITLGSLAKQIKLFKDCRHNLIIENVGDGLTRALYSTYLSYLPKEDFSYEVPKYEDDRGTFVEMLKTKDSGQFSFFTIQPGHTRGSHYHHSKTEKFLILKGVAKLKFKHLISDDTYEITLKEGNTTIVDTIPGWVHNITNIGDSEAYVMLWANEIFDRNKPDTIAKEV